MLKYLIIILTLTSTSFSQSKLTEDSSSPIHNIKLSQERYITIDGDIMININVWGHVGSPGIHTVPAGIDLVSLFSKIGGPLEGSNLSKIKLYRQSPDSNGVSVYLLDMNPFIKIGDRTNFIKIKPNDTIIINKKKTYYFMDKLTSINSVLSLATIFIQLFNLSI